MGLKIDKFFLLSILFLLQSCAGGRIGNFFESSFDRIEEPKIKEDVKNNLRNKEVKNFEKRSKDEENIAEPKIKEDVKNNSRNKEVQNFEKRSKDEENIAEPKIKEDVKNNLRNNEVKNFDKKSKVTNKINTTKDRLQKKQYKTQSYKIIFILKDVDPKDPIEDLSIILRNSDVNFEIEKIERFLDSGNKSIKNN